MTEWRSIEEMFAALHAANMKYIILRNYEEINADNFYTPGHADIDFLTTNGYRFANLIHAVPRFSQNDGIHYKVIIAGTEVAVDARSIGDGYYDTKWERDMLRNRTMADNRFYVMDEKNYYPSLVYHAVLQKNCLADDYLRKLNQMASSAGISAATEEEHLMELKQFMMEHGYHYTLPCDIHVPLRTDLVDSSMIRKYLSVSLRDTKIKVMQIGSKIKHRMIGH